MASYSWGGGGKDEEWFIVGIIFHLKFRQLSYLLEV